MENKDTGAHITHSRRHYTPTHNTVVQTQAILSYSFKILVSSILENNATTGADVKRKWSPEREAFLHNFIFLLYRCRYNNNKSKNNTQKKNPSFIKCSLFTSYVSGISSFNFLVICMTWKLWLPSKLQESLEHTEECSHRERQDENSNLGNLIPKPHLALWPAAGSETYHTITL